MDRKKAKLKSEKEARKAKLKAIIQKVNNAKES